MEIVGLIGIVVALVLFLLLVYKGWAPYWIAPICAVIVAVSNQLDPLNAFKNTFVTGMFDVALSLFSIIFLGAILGKVFTDTGAAAAIAKTLTSRFIVKQTGKKQVYIAMLCVLIMAGLCTMGGIDGYVLTFTMFPITMIIAEIVGIPRRFVPGMMCLNCAFMTAPGAPQIYNVIGVGAANGFFHDIVDGAAKVASGVPAADTNQAYATLVQVTSELGITDVSGIAKSMENLQLSSTAGLIPGIISSLIIAVAGYFTLCAMINRALAKGETFDYGPVQKFEEEERKLPNFWVAILPLVLVFVLYAIFHLDIAIALTAGILLNLIVMFPFIPKKDQYHQPTSRYKGLITSLNNGSNSYPNALMTVVTPAGLAAVIMSTAAFGMVIGLLAGLQIPLLILTVIIVCIIVGLTSSPPAALYICIPTVLTVAAIGIFFATGGSMLGNALQYGQATRVAIIAASTFETLPVNGLIILTLGLARTTHKESYKPMFMMTVAYTLVGTLVAMALFMLFPGLA